MRDMLTGPQAQALVLAPLEATNEMIDAALTVDKQWSLHAIPRLKAAYRAMIAARPAASPDDGERAEGG